MIEIPETCEFIVEDADQLVLKTRTNGDTISIGNLRLSADQTATLAHLINTDPFKILKVEIKEHIPE